MRSVRDRIRHAVCFEVIGLIIVTPVAAWGFDQPMHDIGLVVLVSSLLATAWNYLYNLLFDHAMVRLTGSPHKSVAVRVFHAVLFEFGMLLVLMPFIAWYLGITLLQAFLMDVSFALFYLVYAFVFNWAYDVIFPIPHSAKERA